MWLPWHVAKDMPYHLEMAILLCDCENLLISTFIWFIEPQAAILFMKNVRLMADTTSDMVYM